MAAGLDLLPGTSNEREKPVLVEAGIFRLERASVTLKRTSSLNGHMYFEVSMEGSLISPDPACRFQRTSYCR